MKKLLLSAVVTSLFVPMAYAMDHGAAPAIEVELPAVAEPAVDAVPVDLVPVDFVLEPPVGGGDDAQLDLPKDLPVPGDDFDPGMTQRDGHGIFSVDPDDPSVVICYFGGVVTEELDENGEPIVACEDFPGHQPVDGEDSDPVAWSLMSLSGVSDDGDSPIRAFSSGVAHRGAEAHSASSAGGGDDAPNPQQLGDEQRGAVRPLRTDSEPAQPQHGVGKFLAKFHAPQPEVTQVSATTTDHALPAKRADIDRMRDTALRTGDQKLLTKADKLEQELRAKPSRMARFFSRSK